jgi:hypothetical protein
MYTVVIFLSIIQTHDSYIYYGNFTTKQKDVLEHFVDNIGATSWFNIQKGNSLL